MNRKTYGILCLLTTVVLFSTFEVVSKTTFGKIDAFQLNFTRFFFGGIVLFLYSLFKKNINIGKKELLQVAFLGFINVFLSMNLLQLSLFMENSRASVIAVLFSSNPIFVAIFATVIDKEKIKLFKLLGLCVGLVGIVIVFLDKLDFSSMNYLSPLMALLSAALYGLYTLLGKKVSSKIGSLKMNTYSFILGSVMMLPFMFLGSTPIFCLNYSILPQVLYITIAVTGIAYLSYFTGLSIVGASSGSLVFFIKPALASIIAAIFLHEKLGINLLIGTMLIIVGIAIVVYHGKIKFRSKT